MKAIYKKINFDIKNVLSDNLPYSHSFFFKDINNFYKDLDNLFEFFIENKHAMPIYTIKQSSCLKMETIFNQTYQMMIEAVGLLFNKHYHQIPKFYDSELVNNNPYFVEYAKYTFNNARKAGQAIYGRFDAAFDPITEEVSGIYEFNGDTPVMLLESVHLQDRITREITGDSEAQFNSYYIDMMENLKNSTMRNTNTAIVFDHNFIEDSNTSDVLAQILSNQNHCLFASVDDLDYDFAERQNPFVIGDTYLDSFFLFCTWEDMVEAYPRPFQEWEYWAPYVSIMEPAWRWFMSNKGIWAWMTHLMENDESFNSKWKHLPILRSYLSNDNFIREGKPYASKPTLGRMSANITLHKVGGEHDYKSEGDYDNCARIYQEYCAPHQVEGRNNFIIGMFMAPTYEGHKAEAATFCIREFDSLIPNNANERFIPHIVEFD